LSRRYGPDFFIAVLALLVGALLVIGTVWVLVA
jgi:hypothetical protein